MENKKTNQVYVAQTSYLLSAVIRRIKTKQKTAQESA